MSEGVNHVDVQQKAEGTRGAKAQGMTMLFFFSIWQEKDKLITRNHR